jgi:tRNA threonylcarbamoyladenosine biosynthesis protein TsaE
MMSRLAQHDGPPTRTTVASDSPEATRALGARFGSVMPPGSVVSLEGGLGAGKTLIAKGICEGLGVHQEVLSPSFILVEEYQGVLPVLHFDLYRLEKLDEIDGLGLYDAVDGRAVVLVEWGDRLPDGVLPFDIRITLRIAGEREREITIESSKRFIDEIGGGPT